MQFTPADCLFLFTDVQRGFAGADAAGLVPRLQAFHAELTAAGYPVWHVHMRDTVHPTRQAGVDRLQEPLVVPAPGQKDFGKQRPAPDHDSLFADALREAMPRLVVNCGYAFDQCVEGTLAHAGAVLEEAGAAPVLAIVDDLCAPGYPKTRRDRERWLVLRKPYGMRLIDRADLQLGTERLTISAPAPTLPVPTKRLAATASPLI